MKYEFGSRPWLAALHAIICERARAVTQPGFTFSICEVYLEVPDHLAADHRLAWSAFVRGQTVDFVLEERDDVDFKAIADYAAIVPLGRYDTGGQPDRMDELVALSVAVRESGKLKSVGNPPDRNAPLGSLHDAIAALTA
jgi:hypothetical protein